MKNITLKKAFLFSAALMSFTLNAQAQEAEEPSLSFEQVDVTKGWWHSHRSVPLIGDFNGDGRKDIYYGGTSCINGWNVKGCVAENLGENQFKLYDEVETEEYEVQVPVKDEEGNETGEMTTEIRTRVIGMKNGLPYSSYGWGSMTLDFNQDGLLDFLFLNNGGENQPSGQDRKRYLLVKNLGNFQFELMENDTICKLDCGGSGKFNEDNQVSSVAVGDYDKDGYPDILIQGNGGPEGRFVRLFHNNKGEGFEAVKVFHPLPFDIEPNKHGIYKSTEPSVDEDGIEIPGYYIDEPTLEAKPMSHGGVVFGDFNNDGWLDIYTSGWVDGYENAVNGFAKGDYCARFYKNLGNGEFQDATDELVADGETLQDALDKWQSHEVVVSVFDYDLDGKHDILMTGWQKGDEKNQDGNYPDARISRLLRNVSVDDKFAFAAEQTQMLWGSGLPYNPYYLGDFNGDGYVDSYMRLNSDWNNVNNWLSAFSLSNGSSAEYVIEHRPDDTAPFKSGNLAFGDLDGDYNMDIFACDWADGLLPGGGADSAFYFRNTSALEMPVPEMPDGLAAKSEDGTLTLTWDPVYSPASGLENMYNVYAKNLETGKLHMLVPAIAETGEQLGYALYSNYVLGREEPTYTFQGLPAGQYEVGVQAVEYAYTASAFATATVSVETGIQTVAQEDDIQFTVNAKDNVIVVSANKQAGVTVYNSNGAVVAEGQTNKALPVNGKGVFMVKVNNKTIKVIK